MGIKFRNSDGSVGSFIWSTPGGAAPFAFGNALEFDGVNDYVSLMGANAIKSAQPFSMSFWFNAVDATSTRLAGFSTNAGRGLFIGLSTGVYANLYFICADGSSNRISHTFSNNTWYHCVITYNGLGFTTRSNYNCYINGASKTVNASSVFSSAASEVTIGAQGSLFGGSGIQDEWYYWDNYELTSTDVSNLYNGGSGDYASVVASTPTFELTFNESGTDTTAVDSSGNGNNGTLNNFTLPGAWVAH